jgi:hypothetical protein
MPEVTTNVRAAAMACSNLFVESVLDEVGATAFFVTTRADGTWSGCHGLFVRSFVRSHVHCLSVE